MLRLRLSEPGMTEMKVYQSSGKIVDMPFSTNVTPHTDYMIRLDTRSWAAGIYVVGVNQGGIHLSTRISVMK